MSRGLRGLIMLACALALSLSAYPFQSVSAATGPYTLPFWTNHSLTQGYGCTSFSSELPFGPGTNADGTYYDYCAHFHNGIDYGITYAPVVATDAGTVVEAYDGYPDQTGGCPATYSDGNDVEIDHGNGQFSVYYHLEQNSIVVAMNQHVSAGQLLATSGNSGDSCGPHLHYQLQNIGGGNLSSGHSFNPSGKWTTVTPRIPFAATWYSESNSGTETIIQSTAKLHWVKFKNTGGRTWFQTNDAYGHGKVVLYSTDSSGTSAAASNFEASDWSSSSLVTFADQTSVAPDGIGTFTFYLQANPAPGSYPHNYFNLRAYGLAWFSYATIGDYYIPIVVTACSPGC